MKDIKNSSPCSIVSSFMPRLFLFELLLFEPPALLLLLFLLEFAAFVELGDDVDAEFELDALLLALLLLLFELLPLPPEFEDSDDPPEDCFSFLFLFIIYTVDDHLCIKIVHSREN